ncbi:antibiotic biosynthesis monooxygenase [Mesorhizobium loti]|nr:antibiotic biosynthesis monooxygenase [Mesorhizobium loti]
MPPAQIIINGTTGVLESDIQEFIRSTTACAAETVNEAGCLYYYTGQDISHPNLFRLSEAWVNQESLDAHLASPHFKRAMQEVAKITLKSVSLKRYHVTDEADLSDLGPERQLN